MIHVHEHRTLIGSIELELQCSVCQRVNMTDALRFKTVDKLYGLITIWVTHETVTKCGECGATQTTSISLEDLSQMSPLQLRQQFRVRIGLVEKFLVAAGWILLCVPPLSLALFIGAWFVVPKAAKGWRRATGIGLAVTAVLTGGLAIILVIDAFQKN